MAVSRRGFLGLAGASVVAAALDVGGLLSPVMSAPAYADAAPAVNGRGLFGGLTTLDRTVMQMQRQDVDTWTDYVKLTTGAGEPHRLLQPSGFLGDGYRQPTRVLDAFAHITDMHLVDDQSPARLEFTDRWADLTSTINGSVDSAYRPHEIMSLHIAEAMVRAIRDVAVGPMTGLPFSFTIATGDMTDNLQKNEVRWYIDLLDGNKPIRADSGLIGFDESVTGHFGGFAHDSHYWSPDGDETTGIDNYRRTYNFPLVPGLIAAARRPFTSTGLGMPWYAAMGNHDAELQGNYPLHPDAIAGVYDALMDVSGYATGNQKPYDSRITSGEVTFPASGPDQVAQLNLFLESLQSHTVTADGARVMLDHEDFAKEHWTTSGTPVGHGFRTETITVTQDLPNGGHVSIQEVVYRTYYSWPSTNTDLIQYITLDTVGYAGHADGHLDVDQYQWLETQLKANSSFYYDVNLNPVHQTGVTDRLFVLFGHHTIDSLTNTAEDQLFNYAYKKDVELLLLRYPNVIMYVCGHTHENEIHQHGRGVTTALDNTVPGVGGFWEVATASHIDWPVQSRVIEITAGRGMLSIFNTVIDIAAPLDYGGDLSTPAALASLARELAANDPTERPGSSVTAASPNGNSGRRGGLDDRNTLLTIPAPFHIPIPDVWGSSIAFNVNANGLRQAWGTTANGGISTTWETSVDSNVWSGWMGFGGSTGPLRANAVALDNTGCLNLFVVNDSGEVFSRWQTSSTGTWYGGYASLGQVNARSIATCPAGLSADGSLEIFVTTPGGDVWRRSRSSTYSWTNWQTGFGSSELFFVSIAAEKNSDGRPELFGVTNTGELFHRSPSLADGAWSAWASVNNLSSAPFTKVAVASNNGGRLQVVAADHDRRIWTNAQTSAGGSAWGGWVLLDSGTSRMTQLAAHRNPHGLIEVFGVDHAGVVWTRKQTAPNATSSFTDWSQFTSFTLHADVPAMLGFGAPDPTVTVPTLCGLSQTDAAALITATGLNLGGLTYQVDPATVGNVIGQSLGAGSTTTEGATVDLAVSLGSVTVPDIYEDSETTARAALSAVGLGANRSGFLTVSDPTLGGVVANQIPAAYQHVAPGTVVNYSIGSYNGSHQ